MLLYRRRVSCLNVAYCVLINSSPLTHTHTRTQDPAVTEATSNKPETAVEDYNPFAEEAKKPEPEVCVLSLDTCKWHRITPLVHACTCSSGVSLATL